MIGGSFVERFARTEHEHIEAAPNEIPMSVNDSGVGFDPENAVTQHRRSRQHERTVETSRWAAFH